MTARPQRPLDRRLALGHRDTGLELHDGEEVECPLHAGRFEIKTGKGMGPPIPCDVKSFPVRIEGDKIQVKLGG